MKTLQHVLEDGDPLAFEPGLNDVDARVMRRVVTAAADEIAPASLAWRYAAAMTVMAALMLAVISTVAQREPRADGVPGFAEAMPGEMQFSTPGGTRVIWVFDQSE